MTDSLALARYKAMLAPPSPRTQRGRQPLYSPLEREDLLMGARSMSEIRLVADLLGITFNEAYRERGRLYEERRFRHGH